ncbi:MAG: hypothetical protein MR471_01245, partial [Clostridia bacterium]|nr:hypothetical protein [Clostridia bacterium]
FNFFQAISSLNRASALLEVLPLSQAFVLYHLPLLLSIPFLKVFWGFFGFLCFLEFFLAVKAFSVFFFCEFLFQRKKRHRKTRFEFFGVALIF